MGAENGELESARVARMLRDDIVLGRRLPGSRLVERDIAAELNVSRLPVREAIRSLVGEGIVTTRPRSWATVRRFTRKDIEDLAEVRLTVETLLFVYAAQRHDAEGLQTLLELLEREERAAIAGEVHEAMAMAEKFHEYMTVLAGNEMFMELGAVFVTRLRWLFGRHEDLMAEAVEHRALYEAIQARDVELVRELVTRHLELGALTALERFGVAGA
ncbi:GntR family transcriptional regulator [Microbacterium murale]|uniref:Transcriptional regulator n=1 Tax=Microbacterium murale TaxID=1081040 RepID=A0ABQ1S2T4_9MICO|nr:GntR family transcriptional regulator [Microbacterium murale]GGD88435.1 transcriptional regulator [Microbacterium murale]